MISGLPRIQDLIPLSNWLYEIPQTFRDDMRVSARVFTSKHLLDLLIHDRSLLQLVNTATLPGIVHHAFAMPDIHQGYGFPIGGVVATNMLESGVISPGGIGYDINCGVRLLASSISLQEARAYLPRLADRLYQSVPSGTGHGGSLTLDSRDIDKVLSRGADQMLEWGYGIQEDIDYCEENGRMHEADPELVSTQAKMRGRDQLGTLGSGNHFLEVQYVDELFDQEAAQAFGLQQGMITIMVHCGSRGLGHQVCTDYVQTMMKSLPGFGYHLPDRELACAPIDSEQGAHYYAAMCAAANFAWANRHMIAHRIRHAWNELFPGDTLRAVYDVSHNMGKKEHHTINNTHYQLLVHRKGATRSFGPGHQDIPHAYQSVGQPVLIPGTMGTASYVMAGTRESMNQAFGSCCHGAGRLLSRTQAKKDIPGTSVRSELEHHGITVRCDSLSGLAEEAPAAYKDIQEIVSIVDAAQLARKVAKLKPVAVIKGG